MLVEIKKKVFITGRTGVGKTILINQFLEKNKEKLSLAPITINFSAQTSSSELQAYIESKLEKKRGKKVIGASGKF